MSNQAEAASRIAKNEIVSIPLNMLRRSDNNMRTVHPEQSPDDEKLLASIRDKGILQNLIVFSICKDVYEIPAGGRRFGALEYMAKNGEIPNDFPVTCLVVDPDQSTDVSLTENFQRLAPHPADTYQAFEKMISEGASVESLSRSHGISVSEVNKLLRLAGLHHVLFELFKSDKFNIEQAMAFASTADTALQIAAFKAFGESTSTHPDSIRRALAENRCSSDSALAKFVTVDAYTEANGALENDLFTNTSSLLDLPLLTELAEAKLQAVADGIKEEGWKWVSISLEGRRLAMEYTEVPYERTPVPDDLKTKLQKMEARRDEIADTDWDNTPDELEAELDKEDDELRIKVDLLEEAIDLEYRLYKLDDIACAGCVVTYDMSDGELVVLKGVLNKEDLAAYKKRDADPSGSNGSIESPENSTNTKQDKRELSGVLLTDLGKYRRSITRLSLASQPVIARNLMDFQLCIKVFSNIRGDWKTSYFSPLSVGIDLVSDETAINDIEQTTAGMAMTELYGKLNTTWLAQSNETKSFEAFLKLSQKDRDALVAYAVAQTLSSGANQCGDVKFMNYLMKSLGVSLHSMWRPSDLNYFGRLAKPMLLELSGKWFGKAWTDSNQTSKKSVLVEKLHSLFHGPTDSLNKKQAALRETWIPPQMK